MAEVPPEARPNSSEDDVVEVSPAAKRARDEVDEAFWLKGSFLYCKKCHPTVGSPSANRVTGKGGEGVAGRFSVNTSATTRKKHYRTHVDEARSSSVAETQSAGARRLFSKTPADPAAEAWAWAFVSNGLSYRLIDDAAFRAAVAKTMPQNRASLTQDVRNLASELRHETRARLEGSLWSSPATAGPFIGSPSSTSSSRLCALAVLFLFVLDK
jgi:hypothetical protein